MSITRVAVLADIHGNVDALDAVLGELEAERPELVVVAGDVTWGPFPRETLARLSKLPLPVRHVRGNADRALLEPPEARERAIGRWLRAQHDASMLDVLREFEPTVSIEIAGLGRTLFCHGSPRSDVELFTVATAAERMAAACAGVTEAVVVSAHTHMQFDREAVGRRAVNPGSVGLPYERDAGAFWALLGPGVELRATAYDVGAAAVRIRRSAYPDAARFADLLERPPDPAEVIADAERRAFAD